MSRIYGNYYCRITLLLICIVALGFFAESMITIRKYNDIREDINDTVLSTYKGKHEVLLKLFRAQRNAYLTFGVIFNWVIIYNIISFLTTIDYLTARLPAKTVRSSNGAVFA